MPNIEDPIPVPKSKSFEEESISESSPELEEQNLTREPSQMVKKKRGSKPIYTNSEERKQRNCEAQVAFRRKKAEYIEQSETIITQLKEALQSLQRSHRSAADECLMLRYKNSLLERILLDKGIDVQAELKLKARGCNVIQPPQKPLKRLQKPIRNRRSRSTLESGSQTQRPSSSQAPSNNFTQIQQISPRVAQQQRQSPPPRGVPCVFPSTSPSNATATDDGRSSEHSSLSYKLHLEQIEEEELKGHATIFYDEDSSNDDEIFNQQQPVPTSQQMSTGIQGQPPMEQMQPVQPMPPMQPIHPPPTSQPLEMSNLANSDIHFDFDPYDPMLDSDPFGISASMFFPTHYTSVG